MRRQIVFIHPDLGIGGAERLVVDAALALQLRGHSVCIYTSHHDKTHCFVETRDGTLDVRVHGDWLPRHLLGRMYALCAYIRMIYLAIVLLFGVGRAADVVVADQISACVPILRLCRGKVFFYCHFPDQLLTQRRSLAKRLYRAPLDWLEERTTGLAHRVFVNSHFTAATYAETFTSLRSAPTVLYPSINFTAFDARPQPMDDIVSTRAAVVFLSINRYERKKNIGLAIEAFAAVRRRAGATDTHLVIAGGYDDRVTENKEHYSELVERATQLGVVDHVTFIRSFTDAQKRGLLERSACLVYTPDREHFGIGPLEAMYCERPVIAVNSGGPLETIADGVTGFLRPPTSDAFAGAMEAIARDRPAALRMGKAGRERVIRLFSFESFSSQLDSAVSEALGTAPAGGVARGDHVTQGKAKGRSRSPARKQGQSHNAHSAHSTHSTHSTHSANPNPPTATPTATPTAMGAAGGKGGVRTRKGGKR